MNKKIAKKIVAVAMIVSCLAGMAFGTNAVTMTVGSGSTHPGFYGTTKSITSDRFYTSISGVGFVGLPSNTWPNNKSLYFAYYNANGTRYSNYTSHTTSYSTSSSASIYQNGNYKRGGYTNYSNSCTVGVSFYTL